MGLLESIWNKAKSSQKTIVLPEGTEERTLKAAAMAAEEGLANIVLLGNEDEIKAKGQDLNTSAITIIDPAKSEKYDDYVEQLVEIRKHKGLTLEESRELVTDHYTMVQ